MNRYANFIFIAGLHRSGTSLLHKILLDHPEIDGFKDTGAPEDEGQHLQSIYPTGRAFGGPGKFAFDQRSHMDESHILATPENAEAVASEWSKIANPSGRYFLEKSPPNIVRTRFLQALFPYSKFVVILRHPIAVSYATQKWSETPILSLLDHTLKAYEQFEHDKPFIRSAVVIRYEDLVEDQRKVLTKVWEFLDLAPIDPGRDIFPLVNEKYWEKWQKDQSKFRDDVQHSLLTQLEHRSRRFGYSIYKGPNRS